MAHTRRLLTLSALLAMVVLFLSSALLTGTRPHQPNLRRVSSYRANAATPPHLLGPRACRCGLRLRLPQRPGHRGLRLRLRRPKPVSSKYGRSVCQAPQAAHRRLMRMPLFSLYRSRPCSACSAGTYNNQNPCNGSKCKDCPSGQWSDAGASSCKGTRGRIAPPVTRECENRRRANGAGPLPTCCPMVAYFNSMLHVSRWQEVREPQMRPYVHTRRGRRGAARLGGS